MAYRRALTLQLIDQLVNLTNIAVYGPFVITAESAGSSPLTAYRVFADGTVLVAGFNNQICAEEVLVWMPPAMMRDDLTR